MTQRFTSSAWRWITDGSESRAEPSPKALADLERRKALGPRPDLTGRLMGDPPPGRSALDRKREAEAKAAAAAQEQETSDEVAER